MRRLFFVSRVIVVLMFIGLMSICGQGVSVADAKTLGCDGPVTYTAIYDGRNGDLYLSVENLPQGVSGEFAVPNPIKVTGGHSETKLTVSRKGDPTPGTYTFRVRFKINGSEFIRSANLTIADCGGGSDLKVTCDPKKRTIEPGEGASFSISVDAVENYANLGVIPRKIDGVTCTFDDNPLGPPEGETQLRCEADSDTTNFTTHSLTIIACEPGGEECDTCEVELEVVGSGPPDRPDEPEDEEGDWDLYIDREEVEVDPGQDVHTRVFARFSGVCEGPVEIDIDGSTSGYIKDATRMDQDDFDALEDPDHIYARLRQEELNQAGDNNSDSRLDVKVGGNVPAGVYPIKIDGTSNDEACGEDTQTVVLELIIGETNVLLEKSQCKSTLKPGMTQVYTLRIVNENSPNLTNLVITGTLDSRLEYVSDTSGKTPAISGSTYTWEFNDLGRGEAIEFDVTVKVDDFARAGSSISNRFSVTSDQLPEEVLSNTVTATMGFETVEPDDLRVSKRLIAGRPQIGSILTYRVEVENVGGGAVFGVHLYDDPPTAFKIPAGKSVVDGKPVDPKYRGGRYVWSLGHLAPGERVRVTYQMVVGTNADSGRNENCAEAIGRDGGGSKVSGSDCAIVRLDGGDLAWLGQITAKAFLDVDNNGSRSAADEPLEGVEFILVPPGSKQVTDEEGETVFAELEAKSYIVALNLRTLDRKYRSDDAHQTELVRLLEGEEAEVVFLLSEDGGIRIFINSKRIMKKKRLKE